MKKSIKNRIQKHFQVNDYVFVLDRYTVPGSSRPLKTKFHPSPYIVIRPLWTTTLIKRLADGFTALYSNDDLKKYSGNSPLFANLPPEVSRVLLHDFQDLMESDFSIITKHDKLDLPTGIELFDTASLQGADQNMPDDLNSANLEHHPQLFQNEYVTDEFEPETGNGYPPDELTPNLPSEIKKSPTPQATISKSKQTPENDDVNTLENSAISNVKYPDTYDQDVTDLVTSLKSLSKSQLIDELIEAEKPIKSNDSGSEDSQDDNKISESNGKMTLRSHKKRVKFK